MGCKGFSVSFLHLLLLRFNRNIMGCKGVLSLFGTSSILGFNRNIMGCKAKRREIQTFQVR